MDMFTLHIEHAVLLGLFTVLTLINCRIHDGSKGGYWFPAYMLCAFSGAMLVLLRGHGVSQTASVLYGMACFHFAYLFLHIGLDDFFRKPGERSGAILAQALAVVAGIAGIVEYGILYPDTARRTVFYSLIFAFQNAIIAAVLFRRSKGQLSRPGRLMGWLLTMLGINNLVRAGLTLHYGAPHNYLDVGIGLQLSVLETTVLQGGITVAFVWMTAAVLHERLDHLASTDPLTGLLNRRALEAAAEQEIALSRQERLPLTAVLMDLDGFKQINDTFGHAFGDEVLLEVSRCMEEQMRKTDRLARVGGDEFAVLLHDTSRQEAMEIAERLRGSLEELVVMRGPFESRVRASFGIAEVDGTVTSWPELVTRCDQAVYRVKGIGGNLAAAH